MQFRHLRYFVKIVEAGSFSRAATTIHVAQPALSQQIAELEERLGMTLLQRNPRGVRPTAAGEILYREASAILRQFEQLPSLIRSSSGEPEGAVSLGLAASIAPKFAGPFLEANKAALPKVTLKFCDSDSESLEARVQANTLDIAVVFEDELVPAFARKPLFRQRLYLISGDCGAKPATSISLERVAKLPLLAPSHPNARRTLIERTFALSGLTPNLVAETDALSSELSAVRSKTGHSILPIGDLSGFSREGLAKPILIEPALYLTCSVISSSDFPLTHAGEAVRGVLADFIKEHLQKTNAPGAEWVG
jgi:LysR family transcriptional regulator, nitrogen assimilation regulatory protein